MGSEEHVFPLLFRNVIHKLFKKVSILVSYFDLSSLLQEEEEESSFYQSKGRCTQSESGWNVQDMNKEMLKKN